MRQKGTSSMDIPLIYGSSGFVIGIEKSLKDSLEKNGTYVPDVDRVIYNLKTTDAVPVLDKDGKQKTQQAVNKDGTKLFLKDGKTPVTVPVTKTVEIDPILTTIVFFKDGTRVSVKNSKHDPIRTEIQKLADGSEVKVADRCSKENGLVYAIAKRCCGEVCCGEVVGNGFGRILNGIIDESRDQGYDEANSKALKNVKKAAKKTVNVKIEDEKQVKAKTSEKACNVKFKDMTQEQKRAYWRRQKRAKANSKKYANHK